MILVKQKMKIYRKLHINEIQKELEHEMAVPNPPNVFETTVEK